VNVPVGGFYTREIREDGTRVGFQLMTWEGQSKTFSHVRFKGPFHVGKYAVDLSVMDEIGVPAILMAIERAKLIAVDELARMELFSKSFQSAVLAALECPKPFLGVIQERSHPFLDSIRRRPDIKLFEVTIQNRDALIEVIRKDLEHLVNPVLN
jgi:nucleoside-triphosphatase